MAASPSFDAADALKLDSQLCFPLYACAKEVVRRYGPFLEDLGITYTQYICLMALWEADGLSVRELGQRLCLDSGTLTPLLKRLEARGLVVRRRSTEDERCVTIHLTDAGRALRDEAAKVPAQMACCLPLSPEEAAALAATLRTLLSRMTEQEA